MFEGFASRVSGFVARHDLLTIVLVLLLTVGVGAGLPQLDMEDQTAIDDEVFTQTEVGESLEYMGAHYGNDESEETARSSVYVRPEDGNALSRDSLVAALEYQQTVREDPTVERELRGVAGPPTLVGTHLAGENATLAEQKAAIRTASAADIETAITSTFSDSDLAREYLPRSYEPGTTDAESLRMYFEFEQAAVTQQQDPLPDEDAQQTLYDAAQDREALFTTGTVAQDEWESEQIQDVFMLIVPPALLLVMVVLAFAYRDIADVLLGFVGVTVSVVWFFGILGWLGIPAGFASIVGPVLIVALSIDFGLHVFMRYREQRVSADGDLSDAAIRHAMARSTGSVLVAFLLVALTAGVGFLANVTSPIGFIRAFGVVITLGVLSAVLIFVTLVPALKIRIDTTLERFGVDREKTALGTDGVLKPFLLAGVTLAQRGALVVIVVSVIAGAVGMLAYTEIDRQGFQEDFVDDGDWQTEIPEPFGWTAHEMEYRQRLDYVQNNYQASNERDQATTMLIRGDVTTVETLERVHAGSAAAAESDMTFRQGGEVPTQSPLSLLQTAAIEDQEFAVLLVSVADENERFDDLLSALAAENDRFGSALEEAREATDGRPAQFGESATSSDLTAVYDALYEVDSEGTAQVLERTDGEYRSMRLIVPVEQGLDVNDQGEEMHRIADEIEDDSELDVVPIGFATVSNAGLGAIADSILVTMLLAFGGVALVLAVSYHVERGYATLGAVTVVPILLVIGFVFGGMLVFGVPLTFITAFLVSITIGLGIDYNIHISDRFAQELERGAEPVEALSTTVTGTGGALLGSALTSGAAFAMLLAHPSPVFQSFGFIVVIALLLSFVVSVLVFPSMLLTWARWRVA